MLPWATPKTAAAKRSRDWTLAETAALLRPRTARLTCVTGWATYIACCGSRTCERGGYVQPFNALRTIDRPTDRPTDRLIDCCTSIGPLFICRYAQLNHFSTLILTIEAWVLLFVVGNVVSMVELSSTAGFTPADMPLTLAMTTFAFGIFFAVLFW